MASGCSSGETISELEPEVDDLAAAISQGTVCKEMLERYAQEGHIDLPDQDGKTPLMLACLKQLEDVVLFLLANGANPNSKSLKEGNTPLHYACMVEDSLGKESYYGRLGKKWITPKTSIVKLLLSHGASVQNNADGWSPACVAAFYMLNDIVDFFLSMNDDNMPLEDKIKTSEILGVLHSTHDNRFPSKDAFPSLCRAITLQEDAGVLKGQGQTSELADFFSQLSLKEFHTLEEIRSFELSETALKAHAFLVGDRLFPPNLKQRYLFLSFIHFAYFLMFNKDDDVVEHMERGFQIFSFVLGLERRGELQLGTVLEQFSYAYMFNRISCSNEAAQPLLRQRAGDLFCAYVSVINNVHIDCLVNVCHSLIDKLGVILYGDAFNFSSGDEVKSTVQDIEKIQRVICGRICREKPDEFHKIPSVSLRILTRLQKDLGSLCGIGRRWFIVKARYLLLRILLSDNASYQDSSNGNTLLHMVAYCACVRTEKKCIQDLARAFVRHGCPLDAVNDEGQTARDILQESGYQEKWDVKLVQTLLSPPTTVLRLQEAAARVVLRHKMNYKDILPARLREMVDGFTDADLKMSVLKTKNDSGRSVESSDSSDSSDSSAETSDSSDNTEENSDSSEDSDVS